MAVLASLPPRPVSLNVALPAGNEARISIVLMCFHHLPIGVYSWILRACVALLLINDTLGVIAVIHMLYEYTVLGYGSMVSMSVQRRWYSFGTHALLGPITYAS